MWLAVIKRALELPKSDFKYKMNIEVLYLEKCDMTDSSLASVSYTHLTLPTICSV